MPFAYIEIDCQSPTQQHYIDRHHVVVKAIFSNSTTQLDRIKEKAWQLAQQVNPHKANDSTTLRDKERLILDALGGVLAEEAWFYYINRIFGANTVSFTPFHGANGQIDLLLNNGKSIEIRSSFPRNGVKFAICHERHNFKNICKYDNLYKPSESDKDFFGCALFETPKEKLLDNHPIILYLIGGSTKAMMLDPNLSFKTSLVAENDLTNNKTNYQVIYLKNALDMVGFEQYMIAMGYQKQSSYPNEQIF